MVTCFKQESNLTQISSLVLQSKDFHFCVFSSFLSVYSIVELQIVRAAAMKI